MTLVVNGEPRPAEDPVYDAVLERAPQGAPAKFAAGVVIQIDGVSYMVDHIEWNGDRAELRIDATPLFR